MNFRHDKRSHSYGADSSSQPLPPPPPRTPSSARAPPSLQTKAPSERLQRIFRDVQKPRLFPRDKLTLVVDFLAEINWKAGDFMYELLRVKEKDGTRIARTASVQHVVEHLLRGHNDVTIALILQSIVDHPSSKPHAGNEEADDLFSTTRPYIEIKHALPAITTMALDMTKTKLVQEVKAAVKGEHGLHGSKPSTRRGGRWKLSAADISASTHSKVAEIFEKHQPVGHYLISEMITPRRRTTEAGVVATRKMRPTAVTATEILSTIAFCRTPYARLGPMARATLLVACGAQQTIFQYGSRIGYNPSYVTTLSTLKGFGAEQAQRLIEMGCNPEIALMLRSDNCQQYVLRREMRMGKENVMKIGMSGFVTEMVDCDPKAFNLDDKLERIKSSTRRQLTVQQLLRMIDVPHTRRIGTLQWLQVLVNYIPQLESMKPLVAALYATVGEGAVMPLPVRKTHVYPLATVAKNENNSRDFREAIEDFLEQLGQMNESFTRRIFISGGDGLTFERHLQYKANMRFHYNEFQRGDIIEPVLELWHTGATHVNLIFQAHWGETVLTGDPSRMGHNANLIGQKTPSNMKKIDYYPGVYLIWLLLDVRMLDCWRISFETDDIFTYFSKLAAESALPTFETLKAKAEVLYQRYSTRRAYEQAQHGDYQTDTTHQDIYAVPVGPTWTKPQTEASSMTETLIGSTKGKKKEKAKKKPESPYVGDQVLANSIIFMHDAMLCREFSQAVASGDPGRVWQCIKRMVFSFAGSSHSKYTGYCLEMIARLELESCPELRDAILRNMLINLSGEPGRFIEGDLHLEHINLVLEELIQRKNAEWDGDHIRKVIAPNAALFLSVKETLREGVGLAKRRTKHTSPDSKPEVRTLLKLYADRTVHSFRSGRHYGDPQTNLDTFTLGVQALKDSKLQKWKDQSTRTQRSNIPGTRQTTVQPRNEDEGDEGSDDEAPAEIQTRGRISMVGGEVRVDVDEDAPFDIDALVAAGELELAFDEYEFSEDEDGGENDVGGLEHVTDGEDEDI